MAKLGLAFSAIVYVIFFATFLYLVAFVGNLPFVPRTVDIGPEVATGMAVAIDLLLIALFGVQHSVMARPAFKAKWTNIVPAHLERSFYVLAASAALILLFLFWRPIPLILWQVTQPAMVAVTWTLFALGWVIVLISTFLISHFELFGLKQAFAVVQGGVASPPQFRTPGLYRMVRHPIYLGFLLAFWSTTLMTAGHLLFAVGMTAYILVGIQHEERDLIQLFGEQYAAYRKRVGKLLPGVP